MKQIANNILHWTWTKTFVYWMIVSSGTISEAAFVIASLWMILNKNVHSFFLMFLNDQQTVHMTELATMAFVGLPELILSLAIITTISHYRVYQNQKDKIALTWAILYGVPTVIFLILSIVTLGCSVENVGFELPDFMVITRAIAGYAFGLVALLYHYIGQPQEVNRLAEKDELIIELTARIDELTAQFQNEKQSLLSEKNRIVEELTRKSENEKTLLHARIEKQNAVLSEQKTLFDLAQSEIKKAKSEIEKSKEDALEALPQSLSNLAKNKKTCTIEEAIEASGISKTRISNAIKREEIRLSTRNKQLLMVSSFVEWAKNQPLLMAVNE